MITRLLLLTAFLGRSQATSGAVRPVIALRETVAESR